MQVLSTNCPSLDELLGGGIPVGTGGIVEVSGKAGVGKTQLAIQLALMSVAPLVNGGLQSRSIYAFTEGKKAPDRILAMERALCQRFSLEQGSLLSGILLENIGSSDELQKWTEHRLPYLMRTCDVRVIIVDSVTAVYRLEFGDPLSRANHLVQMVSGLKAAAGRANGVCVCVNQVSQAAEGGGDLSATVPALGAAWGNCVSMRVFLSRMGSRRFAKVLESSWVPVTEGAGAQYRISAGGVVNPDDYRDAEE